MDGNASRLTLLFEGVCDVLSRNLPKIRMKEVLPFCLKRVLIYLYKGVFANRSHKLRKAIEENLQYEMPSFITRCKDIRNFRWELRYLKVSHFRSLLAKQVNMIRQFDRHISRCERIIEHRYLWMKYWYQYTSFGYPYELSAPIVELSR